MRLQHHGLHRLRERGQAGGVSSTEPAVQDQDTRTAGMDGARGPGPGAERGWMVPAPGPGLLADRMDGACSSERTAGMDRGWMVPAPLSAFRCRSTANTPTKVHIKENLIALFSKGVISYLWSPEEAKLKRYPLTGPLQLTNTKR